MQNAQPQAALYLLRPTGLWLAETYRPLICWNLQAFDLLKPTGLWFAETYRPLICWNLQAFDLLKPTGNTAFLLHAQSNTLMLKNTHLQMMLTNKRIAPHTHRRPSFCWHIQTNASHPTPTDGLHFTDTYKQTHRTPHPQMAFVLLTRTNKRIAPHTHRWPSFCWHIQTNASHPTPTDGLHFADTYKQMHRTPHP